MCEGRLVDRDRGAARTGVLRRRLTVSPMKIEPLQADEGRASSRRPGYVSTFSPRPRPVKACELQQAPLRGAPHSRRARRSPPRLPAHVSEPAVITADPDPADVVGVVEGRDRAGCSGASGVDVRRGDVRGDRLEDGAHVLHRFANSSHGASSSAVAQPVACRTRRRPGSRGPRRRRPGPRAGRRPRPPRRRDGRPAGRHLFTMRTGAEAVSRGPSADARTSGLRHRPLEGVHEQQGTPSAIVSTRSTSPPKSACPGVSTTLIR